MKAARYEWADGSRFQAGANADAAAVGTHLEVLRAEGKGELTPDAVVADARNPNSPLHSHFEWDNGKAAEQHRLAQARRLIRAVVVTYVMSDHPAVRTRAYTHIHEGETSHYRSTDQALSQKRTREMVLRRAWDELRQWRRRYRDLNELARVFAAVDDEEKRPESPAA